MAAVNTRVVRRSSALLKDAYGPNFHYNEYAKANGSQVVQRRMGLAGVGLQTNVMIGGTGLLTATLMTVVLFLVGVLLLFRLTREHVLKRFLPKPGQGPRHAHFQPYSTTTRGLFLCVCLILCVPNSLCTYHP